VFIVSSSFHVTKEVVSSQFEVLQVLFKNFMFKKQDTIGLTSRLNVSFWGASSSS